MIISRTYRYVFVELPRSGSTAITRELMHYYDGDKILRKHSTYEDFLKIATPEENEYFVFSCIRHPMDDVVSRYFKLVTDHRQRFTDPEKLKRRSGIVERLETFLYNHVQRTGCSFQEFFMRFYWLPYDNWATMSHKRFDYVLRFEHLCEDFDRVLEILDVPKVRPLPIHNKTDSRKDNFESYYTPEIQKRARFVFGPFLKRWGYTFPESWGKVDVSARSEAVYRLFHIAKKFYWIHLRYRI